MKTKLVALALLLSVAAFSVAADDVYAGKHSDRYHLTSSCTHLKGAKDVKKIKMTEARKRKLTMCKSCQDAKKKPTPKKKKG